MLDKSKQARYVYQTQQQEVEMKKYEKIEDNEQYYEFDRRGYWMDKIVFPSILSCVFVVFVLLGIGYL